jgi:hypothetical protein
VRGHHDHGGDDINDQPADDHDAAVDYVDSGPYDLFADDYTAGDDFLVEYHGARLRADDIDGPYDDGERAEPSGLDPVNPGPYDHLTPAGHDLIEWYTRLNGPDGSADDPVTP